MVLDKNPALFTGYRPIDSFVTLDMLQHRQAEPEPALVDSPTANVAPIANPSPQSVHIRRVNAVEMNRVRVCGLVHEFYPNNIALRTAQCLTGNRTIVRPSRELDSFRNLDFVLAGFDLILADLADLPVIELRQSGPSRLCK